MKRFWLLVMFLIPAMAGAAGVGDIRFVFGKVDIVRVDGRTESAVRGKDLFEGDVIVTGSGAYAQLVMADEAVIAVRPESRLKIETYRYAGTDGGNDRSVINLIKGGFRSITGLIGRKNRDAYSVRTATATIGIRGTDHEPMYIPDPQPGELPLGEPGTYDKVNAGATYIETPNGRIDLSVNQVGFVANTRDAVPQRLQQMPSFMRATAPARPDDARRDADRDRRELPRQQVLANQPASVVVPILLKNGIVENAPAGYAAVGGDLSGPKVGNGATVVGSSIAKSVVITDHTGLPIMMSSNDFNFARNSAPLVEDGRTVVDGRLVRWGVYAGGVISDGQGVRYPQLFYAMGGGTATSLDNLGTTLPNAGMSLTFNTVAGSTSPIMENGRVGGGVDKLAIELKNVGGGVFLTRYDLGVTDAQGRAWGAQLTGSQTLTQFLAGNDDNLKTKCVSCAPTIGTGTVRGVVIGNPTPAGVLSSYSLKVGGAQVGGAVVSTH